MGFGNGELRAANSCSRRALVLSQLLLCKRITAAPCDGLGAVDDAVGIEAGLAVPGDGFAAQGKSKELVNAGHEC